MGCIKGVVCVFLLRVYLCIYAFNVMKYTNCAGVACYLSKGRAGDMEHF